MMDMERAVEIIKILNKLRPNAKSELIYSNPLEFMIAVILSAQATDKGVNKISPALFERFRTISDYANADVEELSSYIKSINYYKTKAERIILACKFLVANFEGKVPKNIDALVRIPGIARKSANVISQEIFNSVEGIVVDTHITRVSQRLGFTESTDAVKIEKDLMATLPRKYWKDYGRQIVLHGRYICLARSPQCSICPINKLCPACC